MNGGELTYTEFIQRRAKLLSEIGVAERKLKDASDPRYTPLVENGVWIAQQALDSARSRLSELVSQWTHQQIGKGLRP